MDWPFVRRMIDREEVGSTSDLARELAEVPGQTFPFCVRARRQTNGRGQRDNVWWSDDGSLTVTLGLDPEAIGLRTEHLSRTALAVAVAVVDAITPLVANPASLGVRWPNDVEAGGLKLAGVLPERVETATGPKLIIGLGVNVSTRLSDAPIEVRRMATSVHSLGPTGAEGPTLDLVLHGALERLPGILDWLARDDPRLAARWAQLDCLKGRTARVDLGARVATGVAAGIDPEGALVLVEKGETIRLFGGRVLRDH